MFPEFLKGFLILFFIFVPLERLFLLHEQKIFRKGWSADALYYFIGYFVGRAAGLAIVAVLTGLGGFSDELQKIVASQPIWLQFPEAVFIGELGYYTAHKLNHKIPWLWKFHSIHHSVEHMDWLAAVRVHPIDQIFTKICQFAPLYILGFSKETFAIYLIFGAFLAFFIHANVRLKFGPLKWVLVTPEVHHWHHSVDPRAYNKNFAAQLSLVDWIFGTLYTPPGKRPDGFGVSDPVPSGYLAQIVYPFRPRKMKN